LKENALFPVVVGLETEQFVADLIVETDSGDNYQISRRRVRRTIIPQKASVISREVC